MWKHYLSLESIYDELQCYWVNALYTLLDDVIPILVLHAFQYVSIELLHYIFLNNGQNKRFSWLNKSHNNIIRKWLKYEKTQRILTEKAKKY